MLLYSFVSYMFQRYTDYGYIILLFAMDTMMSMENIFSYSVLQFDLVSHALTL